MSACVICKLSKEKRDFKNWILKEEEKKKKSSGAYVACRQKGDNLWHGEGPTRGGWRRSLGKGPGEENA